MQISKMYGEDCLLPMCLQILNLCSLLIKPVYRCLGSFSLVVKSYFTHSILKMSKPIVLFKDESGAYNAIESPVKPVIYYK